MKSENEVGKFAEECAAVSARFVDYPPEFLEWLGAEGYELVREALEKRRVPKKVLSLLDAALMMMLAAEQLKGGRLEPLTGYIVAETLPGMTREMGEMRHGIWRI